MTLDPRTAPLDAIRDWFANRNGWQFQFNSWWHPTIMASCHPYPPTRDGAASAMPSDWVWSRYPDRWQADYFPNWSPESRKRSDKTVTATDTNNEIDDRYRLAALAAQTMDAKEGA